MTFYDTFVRLCNSIGKSPSAVALEIGLAKPTVNRWKNGGGVTDATAQKVADYFNVSVSFLKAPIGGEVNVPQEQAQDKRKILEELLWEMDQTEIIDFISKATEILKTK